MTVSKFSRGICTLCPELTLCAANQLPKAFKKSSLRSFSCLSFEPMVGMATRNATTRKHSVVANLLDYVNMLASEK